MSIKLCFRWWFLVRIHRWWCTLPILRVRGIYRGSRTQKQGKLNELVPSQFIHTLFTGSTLTKKAKPRHGVHTIQIDCGIEMTAKLVPSNLWRTSMRNRRDFTWIAEVTIRSISSLSSIGWTCASARRSIEDDADERRTPISPEPKRRPLNTAPATACRRTIWFRQAERTRQRR